jgi:hypothetical protein
LKNMQKRIRQISINSGGNPMGKSVIQVRRKTVSRL